MNRRGFLATIIATATAPAIVRAESLMRIVVPRPLITGLETIWFPVGVPDVSDPLGQRGYLGAKCFFQREQYGILFDTTSLWRPDNLDLPNEMKLRAHAEAVLRRMLIENPADVRLLEGVTPPIRRIA